MVQSLLIFALGFLSAAFIALAVGPAVWRRSAELTRKRIEASLPLSLNELQADKDQLRAEFAIGIAKTEAKARQVQEKLTTQMANSATDRERSRRLAAERDEIEAKAAELEALISKTQAELTDRKADIVAMNGVVLGLEGQVSNLNNELAIREKAIVDQQIELDNRRIELAARATEQQQLSGKVSEVSNARKNLEGKLRETVTEFRSAREALRSAERRANDAEKYRDRATTQLADREERLERREKELASVKETLRAANAARSAFEQKFQAAERQRLALENLKNGLEERLGKLSSLSIPGSAEKTVKKLQDDKVRLLAMVERLTAEKNELVRKMKAASANAGDNSDLRNDVQDLAAKVVALTADQEGARSPIAKLLASANEAGNPEQGTSDDSLAARIRAVQKAARQTP